jgi:hypothetical protein
MALTPITFERFGGLNLLDDPFESGAAAATDLLNVDFDSPGRIRTRGGYTQHVALTMTTPDGLAAFETTGSTRQLVVGYTSGATHKYEAYNASGGAAVATQTVSSAQVYAVRFGTPGNQYLYIGNGADTIWRWTGAAFSQPAGMPTAVYLAVVPTSNRLAAGFTGGGNSRVEFSDAGAPEAWTATSYVDLTPGDESTLTGLVTWQQYVFAFKSRRFFVFTGESTAAGGTPVFNYRTIDGYGCTIPPVAGEEGIYFFDGRSVWLTTGGLPTRISRPIEPFLRGQGGTTVGGETFPTTTSTACRMSYALGRLYLSFSGFSSRRTLVYDPKFETWTYYDVPLYFAVSLHPQSDDNVRAYWLGSAGLNSFGTTDTTDKGSAISWSYKSGKYPLADPGRVAVAPESSLVGSGTVTLRLDSDVYTNQSASATLGSTPSVAEGWPSPIDQEGRWLQFTLSGSGVASVSELKHYVSYAKGAEE